MKLNTLLLSLLSLTAATATRAQDLTQQAFRTGRPEHVAATTTDSDAPRKAPSRVGSRSTAPLSSTGSPRVPVILAQFQGTSFTTPDSTATASEVNSYYQTFCNGSGVAAGRNLYSVRDYFIEQSDSLFLPQFEIIGPVTLSGTVGSYGSNSGSTRDTGFSTFCKEAISLAQSEYTGSWSDFDNDGNGTVDMVFLIWAGMSESSTGIDSLMWPKEAVTATVIGSTTYSCYGATGELQAVKSGGVITSTRGDGIGIFCHELGHALGLPDFYDTSDEDNAGALGMDLFSVMDYGEYCNNGYCPSAYTAYERDFMGWRYLQTLSEPQIVTLQPLSAGGTGYKIVNESNDNEYYVLENRQAIGTDYYLGRTAHGMLVSHVDYSSSAWTSNSVNTSLDHQRMTFIPASNCYVGVNAATTATEWIANLAGMTWPGTSGNTELTDTSVPCDTAYTGVYMHRPLRAITENDDSTVTLYYRTNGQLAAPGNLSAIHVGSDSVALQWDGVDNATRYQLVLEGDTTLTTATSATLRDLPGGTTLSIQLRAMADSDEDYLPSTWTPLQVTTVATGINAAVDAQRRGDNQLFDLAGRKTNGKRPGVYVRNGKKVLIL